MGLKCPPLRDVKIITKYVESYLKEEDFFKIVSRFKKDILKITL